MPDVVVDARGIRPIALDGDEGKSLVLDQLARDPLAHAVELRGAVRRLADENHARIADPLQHRCEVERLDGRELLAAARNRLRQRAIPRLGLALPGGRPPFRAHQRHEADVRELLRGVFVLGHASHPDQFLEAPIGAHGNHQATADLELRLQRLRDLRPAGCDDDRIVGSVIRPAERPVGVQYAYVTAAGFCQQRGRFFGQLTDAFDRVDVLRDLRQHRRGITGSGADFEHLLAAFERQRLGHHRDDIGLGDRLPFGDGQGRIVVGEFPQILRQKGLPRHRPHGRKNRGRPHAPVCDMTFHHFRAPFLEVDHEGIGLPQLRAANTANPQ